MEILALRKYFCIKICLCAVFGDTFSGDWPGLVEMIISN